MAVTKRESLIKAMQRVREMIGDEKMCPLWTSAGLGIKLCIKEKCAWYSEREQKCSVLLFEKYLEEAKAKQA
ncbi:MAG: hypothetical protein ACP5KW_08895 [Thermoproteota archaeon]|jgi:hypothetical protein